MIKGRLDTFSETGTEGLLWCIYEEGKDPEDIPYVLKDGDILTVFRHGQILFYDRVYLDYDLEAKPLGDEKILRQVGNDGWIVKGFQKGIPTEKWCKWFFDEYDAIVVTIEEQQKAAAITPKMIL